MKIKKPSDIVLAAMFILDEAYQDIHKDATRYGANYAYTYCCSALAKASEGIEDESIDYYSYKMAKKTFDLFSEYNLDEPVTDTIHFRNLAWFGSPLTPGAYEDRITALAFTYNILLSEGL